MNTLDQQRTKIALGFVQHHKNSDIEDWQPMDVFGDDKLLAVYWNLDGGLFGEVYNADEFDDDGTQATTPTEFSVEISGFDSHTGNPVIFEWSINSYAGLAHQGNDMHTWHDMAQWTPSTGRYLSVSDGDYGEYTAIDAGADIRLMVALYLVEYDLGDADTVAITVAIYQDGEEGEAWTVNLNKTGITSWTLI